MLTCQRLPEPSLHQADPVAEVFVRGGRLMIRAVAPIPALYRGVALHPDDDDDPYVFRLDLSAVGMSTVRVVFGRDANGAPAIHADLGGQPMSLVRRAAAGRSRPRLTASRAAAAVTAATRAGRRRGRQSEEAPT